MRIIRHQVENGLRIVKVPLNDSNEPPYAVLEEPDFNTLTELGCSQLWSIGPSGKVQVWANKARRVVLVQRLIMDAGPGQSVSLIDGNPFNLRRSNLSLGQSNVAKRRDRDYITHNQRDAKPRARHVWDY